MYGACTHKSIANITGLHSTTGEGGGKVGGKGGRMRIGTEPALLYMNLEIVATKLQGVYACASKRGKSPLLTTGWEVTNSRHAHQSVRNMCYMPAALPMPMPMPMHHTT